MPRVFILILHWEKYEITKQCLESFRRLDYPNYKIVVLDNASKNDSILRLQKEFPEAVFIFNRENRGYGAGMNPGIKYALSNGANYIFLLNNDVIVHQSECLKKLVEFMETNPKVGIAGPKLLFTDSNYQRSYRYFFLSLALGFWWPEKIFTVLRKLFLLPSSENVVRKVDWLNAVALLFKRKVFEDIGLMDERFFLGAEDVDLSLRAKRKGRETWYCPGAELTHLSFISHGKSEAGYDKFWAESTLLFLEKYYRKPIVLIVRTLMVLGLFLRGVQWFIAGLFNRRYIQRAKDFLNISYIILSIKPRSNLEKSCSQKFQ